MKSSKYYDNPSVKCPFYKRESKQEICCSGLSEGSVIHIAFSNGGNKKSHRQTFCRLNYKRCPIARALEIYE